MSELNSLDGPQLRLLRLAMLSAYPTRPVINLFLKDTLSKGPLENYTPGPREAQLAELIDDAVANGWVSDLIDALQKHTPKNALVRNLPDALRFAGAEEAAAALPQGMTLEKIVSGSGFADLKLWYEKMSAIGQGICRIEATTENGTSYGTGILVGDDLVLTNYHVLENHIAGHAKSDSIICRFDYALDANGLNEGKACVLTADKWLLAYSPYHDSDVSGQGVPTEGYLDFAIVRLRNAIGAETLESAKMRGYVGVGERAVPTSGDPVFVVQHPSKRPMALAIGKVQGLDKNGVRLRYDADTEAGSSGSGVFNTKLELVALHHAGDPASKIRAQYNQGIPIGKIVANLRGKGVDLVNVSRIGSTSASAVSDRLTGTTRVSDDLSPKTSVSDITSETKVSRPTGETDATSLGDKKKGRLSPWISRVLYGVGAVIVVGILLRLIWGTPQPPTWTAVNNAEIMRDIEVRPSWKPGSPPARQLHAGDIEGLTANVDRANMGGEDWYRITWGKDDAAGSEFYFRGSDAPHAIAVWKPIGGCLRANKPNARTFNAMRSGTVVDVLNQGEVVQTTELQEADMEGQRWFRFRIGRHQPPTQFRYAPASDVELVPPDQCQQ